MSSVGGLALDPGLAWVKRVRLEQGVARPWPDRACGRLRTPRGALPGGQGWLEAVWTEAGRPDALALVAGDAADLEALRAQASAAAPGARVTVLASALAAALELGAPETGAPDPGATEAALDAVLDLGHDGIRLQAIAWQRWEGRLYPRSAGGLGSLPLGGSRLDEDLAAVCRGQAARPPADAPGFAELKELFGAARGPFVRPLLRGDLVELPAREASETFRGWLERLQTALLTLVEAAREARVGRVLAVGGLLELGPVRELVERAFAGGPALVSARAPSFVACRGAARALLLPPQPVAAAALGVPVRVGGRVALRPLVAAGDPLPGPGFGPLAVRPAPPASFEPDPLPPSGPLTVHLLDPRPDGPSLAARVPRHPRLELTWRWTWEEGWSCAWRAGEAGGVVPAAPAPAEEAAALREAIGLDWAARGRALPVDLLVVFRATRAAPAGLALAQVAAERALSLAAEVARGSQAGPPRLRALAVGDHPQGHIVPAWVTRLSPAWEASPEPVLAFVRELLAAPADGIDPQEAFECALRAAAELDWRPDAQRVVLVLADAPPHTPEEPPWCPVDWRAEAAGLRARGVRLLAAHLAAGGVPPSLRQQALAFVAGLAAEGGAGPSVTVRAGALDELEAALRALLEARAPDPQARALLARAAIEPS